ncbi:TonB-dependent receptor plug domain-containing protein [Brevundimonas sp.]|uniref:TonB-dependent receptor plug domain-containing protein n=1 Tax=Brevundimonas sp. TaxID=1871086 RepID=UPI002D75ACF3|nr:TonB-dependent receptor plug domain-containing protein [Brevundimonas sp.]HYD27864.1 TonB-dependent receptor plug domain-containing protein [Brevundimonas sp.]
MLLVTTALSGLMAGAIQTAPAQAAPPPQQQPSAQQAQEPGAAPQDEAPAPPATDEDTRGATDLGTVNVTAQRPRGSVDSDIPPDLVLSAEEIQAYGASSIAELLTYLEPVTRSSRGSGGQPVMLVNGRRISGFREIQGIPPEAIERVDILPEEVALDYGYRADQRVVNFVLKSNFRSITAQVEGRVPTAGGRTVTELDANLLRISGAQRWSLDLEHEQASPLFESERDLTREPGATPFDLIGNVTSVGYTPGCLDAAPPTCIAIDPALGTAITPVPGGGANPTLADFVAAGGAPRTDDLGAYRTLMSETESSTARGTIKRDLNSETSVTFSASLEDQSDRSFNGLPGVVLTLPDGNPFSPFAEDVLVYRYLDDAAALRRRTDTLTGEAGVLLDGFLGEDWRWTFNGAFTRVETDTVTGRGYGAAPFQARLTAGDATASPFGPLALADFTPTANDTARSVSQRLDTELVLNGDLWELPAGGVSTTFKVGADSLSLESTSTRGGVTTDRRQSRDRISGLTNLNFPIASRRSEVLPLLGDLSIGVNAGFEDLSDFGGLSILGLTINWSPIEKLSFLASYTDEEGAPSISQLNNPLIDTPNVPVFDFRTGETVLVTQFSGGNPNLNAENRRIWKVGITLQPLTDEDLRISSTWTRNAVDDSINAFPTITPDLEAALPGRFNREAPTPDDPIGRLVSIDTRPLNFARAEREDIRTGFNFSKAFGTPTALAAGAAGQPGAGGPVIIGGPVGGDRPRGERREGGGGGPTVRMGGGGRRGGGMQPGQGRFMVSLYHTYRVRDEILIADGLPILDLLDGAATSSRGGSPRHEIQAQMGVFKNGMGAFLNGNWRDGTRIDGGSGPDLFFSDQTTINLNLFVDLGSQTGLVEKYPWLKGTRLQVGVRNLFDSRTEVTSSAGDTPLNYQPDYLDPEGRSIGISLRKILF